MSKDVLRKHMNEGIMIYHIFLYVTLFSGSTVASEWRAVGSLVLSLIIHLGRKMKIHGKINFYPLISVKQITMLTYGEN